jgi:hypothetical protein
MTTKHACPNLAGSHMTRPRYFSRQAAPALFTYVNYAFIDCPEDRCMCATAVLGAKLGESFAKYIDIVRCTRMTESDGYEAWWCQFRCSIAGY